MICVLVEPEWFGGSIGDLTTARAATSIPVLAKEFVVDERQLPLLRAAGADAVLLLAALHPPKRLARLVRLALDVGLEPLVEAHSAKELTAALATDARLIGINNRDLKSLEVDTSRCERLRADVPDDRIVIAESGVRDAATVRRWRALGFDGVLVGEDLMRSGSDPATVEARVSVLTAAGAVPAPGVDPAIDGRTPFVKICGVTEPAGLDAAIAAGADAIGLNFVPGTPRALEMDEAAALVASARAADAPGNGPLLVGIFADRDPRDVARIAARLDLDAVQLSGDEPASDLAKIPLPVLKALHIPAADDPDASADGLEAQVAEFAARSNLQAIILDTSDPKRKGGTGRRASVTTARAIADRVPVLLAGGLTPANVAQALLDVPAIGVDTASGVEPRPRPKGRPFKDPWQWPSSSNVPTPPAWIGRPCPSGRDPYTRDCSRPTRPAAGAPTARSAGASCPRP